jgi:hypothetical protein
MLENGVENVYVGIDESNHGRSPEVFVASASCIQDDCKIIPNFPKIKPQDAFDLMRKRDYRYALINHRQYQIYGSELIASVASELIFSFNFVPYSLSIFIDGELRERQKIRTKELVAEKLNLPYSRVFVRGCLNKGEMKQTS